MAINRREVLKLIGAAAGGVLLDQFLPHSLQPVRAEAEVGVEGVGAVIGATPIDGGGWRMHVYSGKDKQNRGVKIFDVPVNVVEQGSTDEGGRLGQVDKKREPDGSWVEVRDVATERVHFTNHFIPDWSGKRLLSEANGTVDLPDLKQGRIYVLAFCGNDFNPNVDSWQPFSASEPSELRYPTNIVL